jgi:hypothetical protein
MHIVDRIVVQIELITSHTTPSRWESWVDPAGSGYWPVAGSYEYGDETSGSGAMALVS